MESYLSVVIRDRPGATVVAVGGELDMASSPALDQAIERVRPGPEERIVLDLAALEFMDVSGLRVLLDAHHRAKTKGVRLTLVNVRGEVRRLFRVAGAAELLDAIEGDPQT